jgi:hypothetical protein
MSEDFEVCMMPGCSEHAPVGGLCVDHQREKGESLFAKRERLGEDIGDFAHCIASEYARAVRWDWTSKEPDDFSAVIVLELYDGSERSVPLREVVHEGHGQGEMVINIGDCGNLDLDAGGLYAFLWNHDAAELRNVKGQRDGEAIALRNLKKAFDRVEARAEQLAAALVEQRRRLGDAFDELEVKFNNAVKFAERLDSLETDMRRIVGAAKRRDRDELAEHLLSAVEHAAGALRDLARAEIP